MSLYFVYITTNLITNKQYIGEHVTNDINDKYLGGGRYLKASIRKHGKHHFKKEILEYFNNRMNAYLAQENYINKFNTLYPNGYNLSPKGGHDAVGGVSQQTKDKIRNKQKGISRIIYYIKKYGETIGTQRYNANINKFRHKSESTKLCMSLNHADVSNTHNPMYNKKHTSETKSKIKAKSKLRTGSKNSFYGKHHSIDTLEKIRNSNFANPNKRRIKIICTTNNITYIGIRAAERDLKINRKAISQCCRNLIDEYKGYTFKFA